jgi:hypothetical protein
MGLGAAGGTWASVRVVLGRVGGLLATVAMRARAAALYPARNSVKTSVCASTCRCTAPSRRCSPNSCRDDRYLGQKNDCAAVTPWVRPVVAAAVACSGSSSSFSSVVSAESAACHRVVPSASHTCIHNSTHTHTHTKACVFTHTQSDPRPPAITHNGTDTNRHALA